MALPRYWNSNKVCLNKHCPYSLLLKPQQSKTHTVLQRNAVWLNSRHCISYLHLVSLSRLSEASNRRQILINHYTWQYLKSLDLYSKSKSHTCWKMVSSPARSYHSGYPSSIAQIIMDLWLNSTSKAVSVHRHSHLEVRRTPKGREHLQHKICISCTKHYLIILESLRLVPYPMAKSSQNL